MPSLIGEETRTFLRGPSDAGATLSPSEMTEAECWSKKTPGLFGDFYEQPLLNYFVHSMTQRG